MQVMVSKKKQSKANNQKILDFLAWEFVQNHISVSLSEGEKDIPRKSACDFLSNGIEDKLKGNNFEFPEKIGWKRNILVLGAGATYNAYSQIPLANEAIKELRRNLPQPEKKKGKTKQDFILLNEDLNLDEGKIDFETYLQLLTRYYETSTVRDHLSKLYDGKRFYPCLFYDIVAHLLKHSFIDAVINFNFDELLDQAIEEEIGKDHFHYIFSDGHCQSIDKLTIGKKIKKPLYIKPHGTISHKSSLRFTKDHYFDVPKGIRTLLEQLLSGQPKSSDPEKKDRDINLIVVGFDMKSLEFNEILENSLSKNSRIIYFNASEKHPTTGLPSLDNRALIKTTDGLSKDEPKKYLYYGLERFGSDGNKILYKSSENVSEENDLTSELQEKIPENNSEKIFRTQLLGDVFSELWEKIDGYFKEDFKPRGINNHQIVHKVFYKNEYGNKKNKHINISFLEDTDYFKKRMILELCLILLAKNGQIELTEILKERPGLYFEKYIENHSEIDLVKRKKLIHELISDLGLVEASGNKNILTYRTEEKEAGQNNQNNQNLNFSSLKEYQEFLKDKIKELGYTEDSKEIEDSKKNGYLQQIITSNSYEIAPNFRDRQHLIFKSLDRDNIISTNLALKYRFFETLKKQKDNMNWDTLLLVSENGRVIFEKDGKLRSAFKEIIQNNNDQERKIFILLAHSEETKLLKKKFGEKKLKETLSIKIELKNQLSIFEHSHHMAVFLKELKSESELSPAYVKVCFLPEPISKQDCKDQFTHIAIRSIYHYKKGLDHTINPIYLDGYINEAEKQRYPYDMEKFMDLKQSDHQHIIHLFAQMKEKEMINYQNEIFEKKPEPKITS